MDTISTEFCKGATNASWRLISPILSDLQWPQMFVLNSFKVKETQELNYMLMQSRGTLADV